MCPINGSLFLFALPSLLAEACCSCHHDDYDLSADSGCRVFVYSLRGTDPSPANEGRPYFRDPAWDELKEHSPSRNATEYSTAPVLAEEVNGFLDPTDIRARPDCIYDVVILEQNMDRLHFMIYRIIVLGTYHSDLLHGRIIGSYGFFAYWRDARKACRKRAGVDYLSQLRDKVIALIAKHREYYICLGALDEVESQLQVNTELPDDAAMSGVAQHELQQVVGEYLPTYPATVVPPAYS